MLPLVLIATRRWNNLAPPLIYLYQSTSGGCKMDIKLCSCASLSMTTQQLHSHSLGVRSLRFSHEVLTRVLTCGGWPRIKSRRSGELAGYKVQVEFNIIFICTHLLIVSGVRSPRACLYVGEPASQPAREPVVNWMMVMAKQVNWIEATYISSSSSSSSSAFLPFDSLLYSLGRASSFPCCCWSDVNPLRASHCLYTQYMYTCGPVFVVVLSLSFSLHRRLLLLPPPPPLIIITATCGAAAYLTIALYLKWPVVSWPASQPTNWTCYFCAIWRFSSAAIAI